MSWAALPKPGTLDTCYSLSLLRKKLPGDLFLLIVSYAGLGEGLKKFFLPISMHLFLALRWFGGNVTSGLVSRVLLKALWTIHC